MYIIQHNFKKSVSLSVILLTFALWGNQVYSQAPTVTAFSPTRVAVGGTVVITGTNFTGASAVKFGTASNGTGGTAAASFTVNSSTQITAVVNTGTTTGSGFVAVTNSGTGTKNGFSIVTAPTVTTCSPTSGFSGSSVTITGTGLTNLGTSLVASVTCGGVSATIGSVTASSIPITVGTSASGSGVITVVAAGLTLTTSSSFACTAITGFSPTSAGQDSIITITGTNLANISSIKFGTSSTGVGGTAAIITDSSGKPTQIKAKVASGTTTGLGYISLTTVTPVGTTTFSGFTFLPSPTVSTFTPTSAGTDSSVVITGTNYSGVTGVFFGGTAAKSFTVNSSTQITAVVNTGTTGIVSVVTSGGTGTKSGFTFLPSPTVSSFTPTSAGTDSSVVITGTNFSGVTGVSFGGTAAKSFTVNSSTQITAVVNTGTSGSVRVVTSGGSTSLAGFTYLPSPTISSISPTSTNSGSSVIITGTNFNGVTAVFFGGTTAASFTVNSSTQITATVGSGSSGDVSVVSTGGTGTLTSAFTFIPVPIVSSFSPTSASTGATVTITGSGFKAGGVSIVSAVSFGGTAAASFSVINATTIDALVAAGSTGSVSVTTTGGTDSHGGFTYLSVPVISSLSTPTTFGGDTITITGSNFSGATDVQFGGISAVGFSVASGTSMTAAVPSGIVGATDVTVISPAGTSNTFSITINNKWTGSTSADWSDPTNWTAGSVPGTEVAFIPSGITPSPALSTDTYIYDLINNGTLSINGHTLFMETSSGGSGTFIGSSTSILQMDCNDTLYFSPGNNSLLHLIVNSSNVTLGNSLDLYGVLYSITGTLTTNGFLTLKNTSTSQNAMVAAVGGSITGTVTTERYISQHVFRPFIDVCPIVASAGSVFNNWQEGGVYNNGYGILITGVKDTVHTQNWVSTKGFDVSYSGSGSMQTFPGGVWTYPTNTKTMNLDPAMGYRLLARGNRSYNIYTTPQPAAMNSDLTLRTTGNLVIGDVTFATGGTSSTGGFSSGYGLNGGTSAFSFIGNPYASTVSWSSICSHGSTQGVQPYYYYLDPNVRDGSNASTYINYNYVSGTNSNGSSSIADDIQPGMAFFIQQDGSGTSPQILFQEADKTAGNSPLTVFGTKTPVNKLGINLWKGGRSIDGAVAVFKAGFTKGIGKEDSRKLMNTGESITFSESGSQLCIDGMDMPTINDTIKLQLSKMVAKTNYQLKLNGFVFNGSGMNAFVKDKYLNNVTKVSSDSTVINFTTSTDSATYFNRFNIYFAPYILPISNINLTVTENNEHLFLSWNVPSANNIFSFTIQRSANGKDFVNLETVGSSITSYTDLTNLSGAVYYRIRVINNNDEVTYSDAVSISSNSIKNNLSVYPNPIIGSSFKVELYNTTQGKYTLQLLNSLGQKIISQEIIHAGGKLLKTISSDRLITSGIYTLKLTSSNGESFQKNVSFK